MILTAREMRQGEILPPWYCGLSHCEGFADLYYFYPMPFNYLVRWTRNCLFAWNWFRSQGTKRRWVREDAILKEIKDAYMRGVDDGEKTMIRDMRNALNGNRS